MDDHKQAGASEGLNFRILTARYSNPALAGMAAAKVRVTLYPPRFRLKYALADAVKELAPDRAMFGLDDRAMFGLDDRAEFERLYRAKLDGLGTGWVVGRLRAISAAQGGADVVLLCFEDVRRPGEWCHRQVFADWLRERTGVAVEEVAEPEPPAVKQMKRAKRRPPTP
jgi:hypothetical protein